MDDLGIGDLSVEDIQENQHEENHRSVHHTIAAYHPPNVFLVLDDRVNQSGRSGEHVCVAWSLWGFRKSRYLKVFRSHIRRPDCIYLFIV